MKKIGSFKIETSFNVKDRGIVAVGQRIEGNLRTGTYISITISDKEEIFKITGTEIGNPDGEGVIRFGILLSIDNDDLVQYVSENKLKEQVAILFEN